MGEIFKTIYCWFETLFGQNLAQYLEGFYGNEYNLPNLYIMIGWITIATTFAIAFSYYYIINHPRFNKFWHWLITLIINGLINMFIGYGITISHVNGKIADLAYQSGESSEILITASNCWGFGLANFFVSILFFILFSLIIKWKSVNCKYSPF